MHNLPKAIIAIPAALLFVTVYLWMAFPTQFKYLVSNQSDSQFVSQSAQYTKEQSIAPPKAMIPADLDLQTPRTCLYKSENLNIKASIAHGQGSARITDEIKTNRLILSEDCLYIWEENEFTGTKLCGISQYISLYRSFSSLFSPDMFASILPMLSSQTGTNSMSMITDILASCIEGPVNQAEFTIPAQIIFKEGSVKEIEALIN